MRSYWKIKLWAKFVNHFDVFNNLWSRKTQCDHSTTLYADTHVKCVLFLQLICLLVRLMPGFRWVVAGSLDRAI